MIVAAGSFEGLGEEEDPNRSPSPYHYPLLPLLPLLRTPCRGALPQAPTISIWGGGGVG